MNACYKLYNTYHINQDIIVFQPWELQHQTARLVADEFFDQVPIHHSCHHGCKHGWNKKWEPGFRPFLSQNSEEKAPFSNYAWMVIDYG